MNLKKEMVWYPMIFLIFSPLYAQNTWTLEECISYAVEHNLELNDFKYNAISNRETYRQSVRDLLPNLNGFADYNIRYGRSVDPNNNNIVNTDFFSNNYSLNSSIDLFKGFQKLNTIKAARFLQKAANEEVLQQKYLLGFRVMSAFYDIRFYEELVTISKQQVVVSQANYNLVKRQIELGMKAGADLYEAEAILLTDKLGVTQSTNQLIAAKLNLIQEMNLKNVNDITIENELETKAVEEHLSDVHVDSIFAKAKSFVPIIKSTELRTKAAKKEVAVARGNLYPSLSLFVGYGTGYFETNVNDLNEIIPFRTQIKDNVSSFVGVSINIPISNKWSARSKIKQQKIELMRANNNLNLQQQELYKLIQQLVQDFNALQVEYKQSTQKVESQSLSYHFAQKKYEKGLINVLDLYQAKALFAAAQNENLQVKYRLKVNESTLKFYKGLPIFNSINNN